jgi:hypothetical protein
MRRMIVLGALLALALLALAPSAWAGDNFVAPLSGDEEVPSRDTQARGVATLKLREDGAVLRFKVNVQRRPRASATIGSDRPPGVVHAPR